MALILFSLGIIGSANIQESASKCKNYIDLVESKPLLGNALIVISQFLFSLMFIYE
jgi:hypothetical protein